MGSRSVIVGSLLIIRTVAAQSQADSAQCRALLSSPHDSVPLTVGVIVTAFDPSVLLSAEYRDAIGQVLAQTLRVPNPLPVRLYSERGYRIGSSDEAALGVVPIVYGAYRLTAWQDGHADEIRVVGGARAQAFDESVLAALRALSDSLMLPPFPATLSGSKWIELRLIVRPILNVWGTPSFAPSEYAHPLFVMHVPSLGNGHVVDPFPGNRPPQYPRTAREQNIEGRTRLQFVVDATGVPDMSSVQVLEASVTDFASAALAALPSFRFRPLEVQGCHLASLVQMPFEFRLSR